MYLGVKITVDVRMEGELDRRIESVMSAFESLKKSALEAWRAKVEVYNPVVVPMMTYRCESGC